MKKIISLFKRDYEGNRQVINEVVPGAEWVLSGRGIATRKWDGTCCMIKEGILYKRYDAKNGKTPPNGFIPAQEPDPVTGHWPGWLKVGDGPEDRWFREAFARGFCRYDSHGLWCELVDGTYELCGPRINGNKEGITKHILIAHGKLELYPPCDFEGIKNYLEAYEMEGIVWYHPDGRMVKIKRKDFGFKW